MTIKFLVTHKWAKPRFKWSRLFREEMPKPVHWRAQRKHCVKCGAVSFSYRPYTHTRFFHTFYRPWGGIDRLVQRLPPCEGVNSNYDAPIGGLTTTPQKRIIPRCERYLRVATNQPREHGHEDGPL